MKIKRVFHILLTGYLLFLAGCSDNPRELQVLTENLPPFNYCYQDSALGFASEIVQKMLLTANIRAQIQFENWSNAYQRALKEPNTLIFSLARSPEREKLFDWIGQITLEEGGIFARANSGYKQSISLQNLKGLRFCVLRDSYYHQYLLDQKIPLTEKNLASTSEELVNKLLLKETDLVLSNLSTINFTIRSQGYYLSDFEMVLKIPELTRDFYIAISKNSDPELISRLQNAFQQLQTAGVNAQIINRYLVSVRKQQ